MYIHSRYKVLQQIGRGGMSSVYLCTDNNIHKKWAVKCIEVDNKDSHLIKSEIELLKSLDYYLFPRIVDAGGDDGRVCIVTDYIEGETLESLLKREGALSVNIALNYFQELLSGLIYLHSLEPGILYLDMKPSNIMVRKDGEIRLIDFGIAQNMLLRSKSYGSVGYSPPEQYRLGATITEKADVFALAMTLYSMLTGNKPDSNLDRQKKNIRDSEVIPHFLKDLILKCLYENEALRPSTKELQSFLSERDAIEKGTIPILFVTGLITLLFIVFLFFGREGYMSLRNNRYKEEMLNKASVHIENGSYTRDGLRIICGYIDSGLLDKETEENVTYEVAKNYFDIQQDYAKAQIYFNRVNIEKYPDATEYLKICDAMRSFNESDLRIIDLMKGEISTNEK